MIDFKALANRSVTVKVAGEDVTLRSPRELGFRKDFHRFFAIDATDRENTGELNDLFMRIQAHALHECVVLDDDQQDMTVDDWHRLLYSNRSEMPDGMNELIKEAMKMCGFNMPAVSDAQSEAAGPDGPVQDHIDEAADLVGKPVSS